MNPTPSDRFLLDNLIGRMREIGARLREDPENRALEQQWIFIRRVIARTQAQRPLFKRA